MKIQIGDDVTHNDYPVGTLIEFRTELGNGCKLGMVQIHGHADAQTVAIPMSELRLDARHTEAAL